MRCEISDDSGCVDLKSSVVKVERMEVWRKEGRKERSGPEAFCLFRRCDRWILVIVCESGVGSISVPELSLETVVCRLVGLSGVSFCVSSGCDSLSFKFAFNPFSTKSCPIILRFLNQ